MIGGMKPTAAACSEALLSKLFTGKLKCGGCPRDGVSPDGERSKNAIDHSLAAVFTRGRVWVSVLWYSAGGHLRLSFGLALVNEAHCQGGNCSRDGEDHEVIVQWQLNT